MTKRRTNEDGYLLVGLLVLIFIVLLTLGVAAPTMLKSLRRDQEVESMHRAQQYQRAIRLYYLKLGHYPASIDQLENTNNMRFLRRRYVDPLTGKDDWRLIHFGQAKAQIKGFFGKPIAPTGGGLGAAAGMGSNIGGINTTANPGLGGSPGLGATGSSGATGSTGSTSPFGGIGSQSASSLQGTGGLIVGVGTSKTGPSLLAINGDEVKYEDWEFTYDPRVEQLRAQASLLGGAPSSGSLGSLGSSGSTGSTGSSGSSGSSGATGTSTTPQP
ncbi:MAG TPA: hypothetical protein VGE93_08540 [Bryobacteraceae bacterium]|nr:type II secretion system protein [Acidobacteriaceae bacterium]